MKSTKQAIHATVAQIKANRTSNTQALAGQYQEEPVQPSQNKAVSRHRASKHSTPLDTEKRKHSINQIIKRLLLRELTQGEALKALRLDILGLRQEEYAKFTGVSRKALSDVENDRGNYNTAILDKLFKPFGLQVGMVPVTAEMLKALVK